MGELYNTLNTLSNLNTKLGYVYYEFHKRIIDLKDLYENYSLDFQFVHANTFNKWRDKSVNELVECIKQSIDDINTLIPMYEKCFIDICESDRGYKFIDTLKNTIDIITQIEKDVWACDKIQEINDNSIALLWQKICNLRDNVSMVQNTLNNNHQPEETQQTTKQKQFRDYILITEKELLLRELHNISKDFNGGRDFASLIQACINLGILRKPSYQIIKKEFENLGAKSNYDRCIAEPYNDKITPFEKRLEAFIFKITEI